MAAKIQHFPDKRGATIALISSNVILLILPMMNIQSFAPGSRSSDGVVQCWHLITTPSYNEQKKSRPRQPHPPNMTGLTSSALVFQKLWGSVLAILLAWGNRKGVRGITLPYRNPACTVCIVR